MGYAEDYLASETTRLFWFHRIRANIWSLVSGMQAAALIGMGETVILAGCEMRAIRELNYSLYQLVPQTAGSDTAFSPAAALPSFDAIAVPSVSGGSHEGGGETKSAASRLSSAVVPTTAPGERSHVLPVLLTDTVWSILDRACSIPSDDNLVSLTPADGVKVRRLLAAIGGAV